MEFINLQNKELTGNWLALQIVTLPEIINCPDILTNTNANTVNIVAEENTVDVLPVPEAIQVSVKTIRRKSNFSYSIKIQVDFPYQSSSVDDFLNNLNKQKVIAVGLNANDEEKIFGSKLHPLTFDYELTDGKKLIDGSNTRVIVSGKIPQKPVFITNL